MAGARLGTGGATAGPEGEKGEPTEQFIGHALTVFTLICLYSPTTVQITGNGFGGRDLGDELFGRFAFLFGLAILGHRLGDLPLVRKRVPKPRARQRATRSKQ